MTGSADSETDLARRPTAGHLDRPPRRGIAPSSGGSDPRPSALLSSPLFAPGLTLLFLFLTAVGLLSLPVGDYDDSILLVGARLTNSGRVPYIDFYSHYGALGFTGVGALMRVIGDPGMTLRATQIVLLCAVAFLLHLLFRLLERGDRSDWVVPFLVLWLGQAATLTAFLGFSLAFSSLILYVLAGAAESRAQRLWLGVISGLFAAGCALTRPAFAIYLFAAVILAEIAMCFRTFPGPPAKTDAFAAFAGSGFFGMVAAWWLLFPTVSPRLAFQATFVTPARLVAAADSRYLPPTFLAGVGSRDHGVIFALLTGAALASTFVPWWTSGSRSAPGESARISTVACIAAGGLLPLVLIASRHPARDANLVAVLLVGGATAAVWVNRRRIASSNVVRASAIFGLTGAAFGHYYWARADSSHLVFPLTLGLVGVVLFLGSAKRVARIFLLSPVLVVYFASVFPFSIPAIDVVRQPGLGALLPWRCVLVPADARAAVEFADRHAARESRFVAVGSSQAWSSANPVQLFLLSARVPYTKWFQYDPGIQTSASVQREMMEELSRSGSLSAVVWRADRYLFDLDRPRRHARSPFDVCFDRLYPVRAARIGRYEIRVRSPDSELLPGECGEAPDPPNALHAKNP